MIEAQLLLFVAEHNTAVRPPPAPLFEQMGLTAETIEAIRTSGLSASEAATRWGVSRWTAWRIQTGRYHARPRPAPRWRRVPDEIVEEIRVRHEEAGWTIAELAGFYKLPRTTILSFCEYRRR